MYIATVIPISKGIKNEELSYFTAQKITIGSIVSVPVRSKVIDAIVIDIEDASNLKGSVKDADFQLKKIEKVKGLPPYRVSFFKVCEKMKNYYASKTGNIVNAMLPKFLIERYSEIFHPKIVEIKESESIKGEKLIFQALFEDRLSWYKTLVREAFAKKESIFICLPTEYDINRFYEAFSKGIEKYVYKFHSNTNKKTLIGDFNSAISETHPILIISTGTFLSIPRYDIKTIVVEQEASTSYKQIHRPYTDIRNFAEALAETEQIRIIFGDTLLRPETLHRHDIGELGEIASPLFRLPQVERQIIVDMKNEKTTAGAQSFQTLSQTTKEMIQYAMAKNETVFLFTVRKGLAGFTVCHDCGHTMLCKNCNTPVVLYGSKQKTANKEERDRIFMCNKCGVKESASAKCPKCDSWNLTPLGIGIDKVYEETKLNFPNANIVQIDKETTSSEKEMQNACNSFYSKKGAILIGTELAFFCLKDKVTHSAIISIDGLMSIPSFNINQKILHLIEKLHSITERNLIIQTRVPENLVLKHILTGNVLPLFRDDLKEREAFGYPPFRRLIKITFRGTSRESEKARSYLEEKFEGYDPQIFSAFIDKIRGQYVTNTVLKIDPSIWKFPPKDEVGTETKNLHQKLSSLPPSFSINIDPEDLL